MKISIMSNQPFTNGRLRNTQLSIDTHRGILIAFEKIHIQYQKQCLILTLATQLPQYLRS